MLSHLTLAHLLWEQLLQPTDTAIDATCGNGHDTLKLAILLPQGTVIGLDLQKNAIEKTKQLLTGQTANIHLYHQSHATFPEWILPGTVSLIVYNLGYLPGSDKVIKTQGSSTLLSLQAALPLLKTGGMLSVMCYPGHPEGEEEKNAVLNFLLSLNPYKWGVSHHTWIQGIKKPELIIIQNKRQVI